MLVDSHCHLAFNDFEEDIEEIIQRAKENGVNMILNAGNNIDELDKQLELSEKYPFIYAAVGVHPHNAQEYPNLTAADLISKTSHKKVIGIGETGLDYYYDLSPRETQKKVFLEQLELARALKLPSVVHLRDAYGDMYKLLKENRPLLEYGFLLHCYSGSKEMLSEFAKMGAYFSFGGAVTFKNAVDKPDVVRSAPTDRILLETDCPYMTPVPFRGKPNRPEYIVYTAEKIASFLGKDREEIEDITLKNTKEFFKKIDDSL